MYLKVVEHPGVFEGRLAKLGGFLLELLDGALVNATALVDQVTGGGRLAGVDVANDHKGNMLQMTNFGVSLVGNAEELCRTSSRRAGCSNKPQCSKV